MNQKPSKAKLPNRMPSFAAEFGAKLQWNARSSEFNKWDTLGEGEKSELIKQFIKWNNEQPQPFNPNPSIVNERLHNMFRWVREHPKWREKHPTGPVTWDFRCERCGFTIEDVSTLGRGKFFAQKDGVTVIQRVNLQMLCSNCAPIEEGDCDE